MSEQKSSLEHPDSELARIYGNNALWLQQNPATAVIVRDQARLAFVLGYFQQAVAYWEKYFSMAPAADWQDQLNFSHALFADGKIQRAWEYYDARLQAPQVTLPIYYPTLKNLPQWMGEPLAGKNLLVMCVDQGAGDNIQMLRYVRTIRARAEHASKHLNVLTYLPLERLFAQSFADDPHIRVIRADQHDGKVGKHYVMPQPDYVCPVMSLPRALKLDLPDIRSQAPYLRTDRKRQREWQHSTRETAGKKFRIGICWAGSPGYAVDALRSCALNFFEPLLLARPHDTCFFAMQKNITDADNLLLKYWHQQTRMVDLSPHLPDWHETACAIQAMDLMICVDTGMAHLAGALGKPVWMLNRRRDMSWRWLMFGCFHGATRTPWYDSMKIYTQTEFNDWKSVIARMLVDLIDHDFTATR